MPAKDSHLRPGEVCGQNILHSMQSDRPSEHFVLVETETLAYQ